MQTKLAHFSSAFLIVSLVLLVSPYSWAAWGPDSENYNEEAAIIGTWVGVLEGKPFEMALWPNHDTDNLSGVMISGECTAKIAVGRLTNDMEETKKISERNSNLKEYLFSLSSSPITTNQIQSECPSNRLSEFYLESDNNFRSLTAYAKNNGEKVSRDLTRNEPSRYLSVALEYLAGSDTQYSLTMLSKDAIYNPNRSYLDSVKLFPAQGLTNISKAYYVSEYGGIYQIDEVNQGTQGQYFFYLKVIDLGPHNSKLNFSLGDNAGSGEFNADKQMMSISLYDQSDQCGQIRKPATEAKITLDTLPTTANNDEISWTVQSKGLCTSYQFYGRCNPKQCDRWFRDQVSNPNIKAIITENLNTAKAQASVNASAVALL
ncbi:hypothetical protein [Aurantivibrio infirmus]